MFILTVINCTISHTASSRPTGLSGIIFSKLPKLKDDSESPDCILRPLAFCKDLYTIDRTIIIVSPIVAWTMYSHAIFKVLAINTNMKV